MTTGQGGYTDAAWKIVEARRELLEELSGIEDIAQRNVLRGLIEEYETLNTAMVMGLPRAAGGHVAKVAGALYAVQGETEPTLEMLSLEQLQGIADELGVSDQPSQAGLIVAIRAKLLIVASEMIDEEEIAD